MSSPTFKFLMLFLLFHSISSNKESGTTADRTPFHQKSLSDYLLFSSIALICVLFGGLMSGLTVGLLGIDELELELKLSSGTPEEKESASKILAVISHHHLLLVTLLIANSAAMETLPLFLDELFNTEITILISVSFVLAFGEVIPQALCTGENQMKIATKMIPLVKVLMMILMPLSYPIAKLLDCIFKHHDSGVKLKTNDLKTFISLHESFNEEKAPETASLDRYQINIMTTVIDLNRIKIKEIMQPYKEFLILDIEAPVIRAVVEKIAVCSYHYIPIYRRKKSNLIGVIRIQELFKIWEGDTIEDSDIILTEPVYLHGRSSVLSAFKLMEQSHTTIAFVIQDEQNKKKVLGVVTKERILERMVTNKNKTEREEISEISHALADTLEKPKSKNNKNVTSLKENFI